MITEESVQEFWRRWSKEYVVNLRGLSQSAHPWKPTIGDHDLIKSDQDSRIRWKEG